MLSDLSKGRIDDKKPRREGLTYITDKLQGMDRDNFEIISSMIDVVKIHGAFPLLISEAALEKKIKYYHDFDILVSTGSTITEYTIMENSFERFIGEAARVGFDIIQIGENNIDLTIDKKEKIANIIRSKDLEILWKVGKKDPRHQLGINETLSKIDEAIKADAKKIILEANQGMAVGIYDEKGLVKWNFVGALTAKYPPMNFIFETPFESQQSSLIAEFGQRVNMAEVQLDFVPLVESQRRGFLSNSTYGISSYSRKEPEGGPASKFIYYIINSKHPIEQGELIHLTHLPRRTIQNAIDELKHQGLIIEKNSLEDTRRKTYYPVKSDWL
jgi:phosphosulfolactate synthase